jgi:lysophospholipase L1-like esterase
MRGRRRPIRRPGRSWPRLAGALCASALVTVASGCDRAISPPGPVVLVGDSIFFMASDELRSALSEDGWEATVDAYPGAGIRNGGFETVDWPARLRDLVAFARPEVVVVELGTNGCGQCEPVPSAIPDAIDANMAQLRDVEVVLWLEVATFGPGADRGRVVNAALRDAADEWDNLELLPYDGWFAGRTDLIPADDVHPTPEGEQALARHVAEALQDRAADTSDGGRARALGALAFVLAVVAIFRSPKAKT